MSSSDASSSNTGPDAAEVHQSALEFELMQLRAALRAKRIRALIRLIALNGPWLSRLIVLGNPELGWTLDMWEEAMMGPGLEEDIRFD
jgi:hypothetical protein